MPGPNASASQFGWDFQVNAAIVLTIENIKEIKEIRVEGEVEDIELTFDDGGHIYSQAKSVVNASFEYKNVRRNLAKGLSTLNNAAAKQGDYRRLVYITNSNNPLNDSKTMSIFGGGYSRRPYASLPPSCKNIIDNIVFKNNLDAIDKTKLSVHVLPFETDSLPERYKIVTNIVRDFLASIKPTLSGVSQKSLDIWQKQLYDNTTMCNTSLTISKEQFMWPLIVIMCDCERRGNPFTEIMDDGTYDEIYQRYQSFIDCRCQKFKFVTKVLTDFQGYPSSATGNKKVEEFARDCWLNYADEFSFKENEELSENLSKIVLYQILQQRYLIQSIKAEVNML